MKTLMRICLPGALLLMACGLMACGSSGNHASSTDMAMQQANPDMAEAPGNPDLAPACFMNPTTHFELINACTTADFVDKMPFYPTLAPNGQLPPLP